MWTNPSLNSDEWLLSDIAAYLERSYSHVRGLIRAAGIKPKRRIQQMPVYTTRHVERLQRRNTKSGPKSNSKRKR